jgi:putative glutathione S-transferase
VYDTVQPGYVGRCTAPLLVDKLAVKAVCNESSDLVAMLNDLQLPGTSQVDLRPPECMSELEQLNELIYDKVIPFLPI